MKVVRCNATQDGRDNVSVICFMPTSEKTSVTDSEKDWDEEITISNNYDSLEVRVCHIEVGQGVRVPRNGHFKIFATTYNFLSAAQQLKLYKVYRVF